ncbi:MFS transporter [Kineosporia mesophila]|uniref:MFS transporter n=1 Tax=Kineosporia mesophila TaxID=566012 RepID=UPI001E3B645B|nr:MFS transporter [Kineosporia mesophila]
MRPPGLYGLPASFWALWAVTLVLAVGHFVAPLMSAWLSRDRGLDAATIGLVVAAFGGGGIVASLCGGYLADRFGGVRVVVAGQLASAGLLVALAQPVSTGTLAGLLFAYGATSLLPGPALSSLIGRLVPPALRERAYSLRMWAINCGYAIGPAFAGWLSTYSFALVFYLEAVLLLAVLLVMVPLLRSTVATAVATPTLVHAFAKVRHDGVLWAFTAIMTLYLTVYLQGTATLPIVMTDDGFSVPAYSTLLTINGALLCLLQIPMIRVVERLPKTLVMGSGVALTAVGYLVQVFATQWWHWALAVVLWTVGELGIFPVASTVIADIAPRSLEATYQGVHGLCWPVGRVLAAGLGGLALARFGAASLWWSCVAALCITVLALLVSRRAREKRETLGRAAAIG